MTDTSPATPYGTLPPASPLPQRRPISLPRLAQLRAAGEKIAMLTAYDATFAAVADAAGVECILGGVEIDEPEGAAVPARALQVGEAVRDDLQFAWLHGVCLLSVKANGTGDSGLRRA